MFEAVLYAFIFYFYSFFLQAFYGCGYGAEVLFLIVAFQFEVYVCVCCQCKMDRRILLTGFLDEHRLGLFIFATLLLLASKTPALSPSAAAYYFIGTAIRQCHIEFGKIFHPSPAALLLWLSLLGLEEWYDWGCLAVIFSCWCCISSLMWIHSLITRIQGKIYIQKIDNTLLYIGRNTLPIYLFHPIFTMAAKFYHPLFAWDPSEISFAAVTIILAITGSLLIAKMMEKTKLAYLFGKGKLLR